MVPGYLVVGCSDYATINHCATGTYITNLGVPGMAACGCEGLCAIDNDGPYTTPEQDDAPWYDDDVPESRYFAGVVVTSTAGENDSPYARTVTPTISGGGLLSRERIVPRTIRYTAWLAGATCCSSLYGLRWFIEALRGCGVDSCRQCEGETFSALDCCPSTRAEACPPDTIGAIDEGADLDGFLARHLRCLRGAAVVDGPRVLRTVGTGCGCGGTCLIEVEWTVVAPDPFWYTQPRQVATIDVPDPADLDCAVDWCVHPDGPDGGGCDCDNAECTSAADCATDPMCQVATPPAIGMVDSSCVCQPLAEVAVCQTLDTTGVADWSETRAIIEIVNRGTTPIRGLSITFHQDRLGRGCDSFEGGAAKCDACVGLLVGYIPPSSAMTLDGVERRATIDCNGGVSNVSRSVAGTDGGPAYWASLVCGDNYCICIRVDAIANETIDAVVNVSLVGIDP